MKTEYIYIVSKNADFTEGRGPMLFDCAFTDGEVAISYVEDQDGIYGSPQKVERDKYGAFAYGNGYDIKKVPLYNSKEEISRVREDKEKATALGKLTTREKRLLGLKD